LEWIILGIKGALPNHIVPLSLVAAAVLGADARHCEINRAGLSYRVKTVIAVMLAVLGTIAIAQADDPPAQKSKRSDVTERTVFVTGSLIPQRIQVRRVGTTTLSPVRVIDRQEIDQTGRVTTPGALINDPSLRIIGH
jgi:hypothetical protein